MNEKTTVETDTLETPEGKKEVMTEVTSIAEQEELTGQKINIPKEEELVQMAGASLINSLVRLERDFIKLSSRGKTRVLMAILNIPTDGIPVRLQSDQEKLCFAMGQRAIADRFILTQYHIQQEVQRQRKEAESNVKEEQTKEKEKDDEKEMV